MEIKKVTAEGKALEAIRGLFSAYEKELGENLCFQGFAAELENPLKKYGSPNGALFLAEENGEPAGCIALCALPEPGICEMKRLYVPSTFRGRKLGETLVTLLLEEARKLGYSAMRLDTLDRLRAAIHLYRNFGFTDISAYYHNPLPGVVYMEKRL